jgi:hypothetical protein
VSSEEEKVIVGRRLTEGGGTRTGMAFGDAAVSGCHQRPGDAQRSSMHSSTKDRLHEAARTARLRYPGAVGELLNQELLSWMVFGHQLGSDLIMRVAAELLTDGVNTAGQPERVVPPFADALGVPDAADRRSAAASGRSTHPVARWTVPARRVQGGGIGRAPAGGDPRRPAGAPTEGRRWPSTAPTTSPPGSS